MKKALLLFSALVALHMSAYSQVTFQRIVGAADETQNWLTYSGRYSGWRYSTLDQINTSNANLLTMRRAFPNRGIGEFETTPIAVDGFLYGTGQNDRAFAIDARTGRAIWRYERTLPQQVRPCCASVDCARRHSARFVRAQVDPRRRRLATDCVSCSRRRRSDPAARDGAGGR